MATKVLKEFGNSGGTKSSGNSGGSSATAIDIAKKYKFSGEDATPEAGLVIGPNGMVAVEYDIAGKNIVIRPDNDLALGSQDLSKFKSDFSAAEKLASEISKIK